MREAAEAPARDLSGVWHGQYSYPRSKAPVAFAATLTESGSWLHGMTQETGTAGNARGLNIQAALQGRRTGRCVTWLKIYDGSCRYYDTVHYAGDVNIDRTEIEGSWTIPGVWSGRFLMIRSGARAAAGARETAETA